MRIIASYLRHRVRWRITATALVIAMAALAGAEASHAKDPRPQSATQWQVCGAAGLCKSLGSGADIQFLTSLLSRNAVADATPPRVGSYFDIRFRRGGQAVHVFFTPSSSKIARDNGSWFLVSSSLKKRLATVVRGLPPTKPPVVNLTVVAKLRNQVAVVRLLNNILRHLKPTPALPTGRRLALPVAPATPNPWFGPVDKGGVVDYYPDSNMIVARRHSYQLPPEGKIVIDQLAVKPSQLPKRSQPPVAESRKSAGDPSVSQIFLFVLAGLFGVGALSVITAGVLGLPRLRQSFDQQSAR